MITSNDLYIDLMRQIRCGILTEKLPSVSQLTKQYKISHNTVQRAVERLKHQGVVYGHHGKGVFVCKKGSHCSEGRIAILQKLENMNNPFYLHLFQCLKESLAPLHIKIDMICGFTDTIGGYDAVIIVENFLSQQDVAVLKTQLSPEKIITLNWEEKGLPSVGNDNYQGGYRSLEYLYDLGCRSVCLVREMSQVGHIDIFQKRYQGVEDFLKRHPDMVLTDVILKEDAGDQLSEIVARMGELEEKGPLPEVIFTFAGTYALGIITYLQKTRRSIPEDVSLLCYDNVDFATFTNPPLTTVKEGYELLAEQLKEYINALVNGAALPVLQDAVPEIIERSSVRSRTCKT